MLRAPCGMPSSAVRPWSGSHRDRHPIADLALGTDPLTTNRYTYVNGDPVNLIDPTGHEPGAYHPNVRPCANICVYRVPSPGEETRREDGSHAFAADARRRDARRDAALANRARPHPVEDQYFGPAPNGSTRTFGELDLPAAAADNADYVLLRSILTTTMPPCLPSRATTGPQVPTHQHPIG